jgi:hypothetical protein
MAVSSQKFDTLDGLNVTGPMDIGGNVTVDTNVLYVDTVNNRVGINKVPTVAFDVSGDVNIDGGTIDGLTQLSVDSLTLNGTDISSSTLMSLTTINSIELDAGSGVIKLQDSGTEFGRLGISGSGFKISSGASVTDAVTFQSDGDAIFAANVHISDSSMLKLGSVQNITADSQGAIFSSNTYHQSSIVSYFGGAKDVNTYLQFNAGDSFQITTGGTVRFTANNSGVTIPGALLFDSVASDQPIYETINTTATRSINLQNGSAVICTATGGGAVTFTMPTSPGTNSFAWTVKFNNSGSLTWPASVQWAEGVQPPESSGTDIYSFVTYDGGTTIYGSLAVRNAS